MKRTTKQRIAVMALAAFAVVGFCMLADETERTLIGFLAMKAAGIAVTAAAYKAAQILTRRCLITNTEKP